MARMTSPSFPRSLPVSTLTRSPFLIFNSKHLRCQRHDAHELLVPQLAAHRTEDAGAARLELVVDEDSRVLVEADVAAVRTPLLLLRAHDHALHDVALLHGGAGDGVLDGGDEDVADRRVAPLGAAQHLDAEHLLGAAVVSDPKSRLLLDHRSGSFGAAG